VIHPPAAPVEKCYTPQRSVFLVTAPPLYAHSRIAKYMATPTEAAWDALRNAYAYIRSTINLCISAPMHATTSEYSFFTDADHAGNREQVNKTRSH